MRRRAGVEPAKRQIDRGASKANTLETPQNYPRAGSQSYPSPSAKPDFDGSTTIYFGPQQPPGIERGNWIQTMPGKGWNTILRLHSPLEPFFTKMWRPSEIDGLALMRRRCRPGSVSAIVVNHTFRGLRDIRASGAAQAVEDSRIVSLNLPAFLSPSLAAMLTHAPHRLARVQGGDS